MKLFDRFRKQKENVQAPPETKVQETPEEKVPETPKQEETPSEEFLNDVTYISSIKHISDVWQQYDVLLAARGYGWAYMLSTADYLASADLENISEVESGQMNSPAINLTEAFRKNGGKVTGIPELAEEQGVLSIAGLSKALHSPVKIVWFNQTKLLRLFTLTDNVPLIEKYAETVIRRTFGTKDAMKRGRPIPGQPGR